jgi:hypothetical protein
VKGIDHIAEWLKQNGCGRIAVDKTRVKRSTMLKKLFGGLSLKDADEAQPGSFTSKDVKDASFSQPSMSSATTAPSFTHDYAFPCLWDAEIQEEEADAVDQDEEELDAFEFEAEAPAVSRRSSQLPARAVGPDGTPLVRKRRSSTGKLSCNVLHATIGCRVAQC